MKERNLLRVAFACQGGWSSTKAAAELAKISRGAIEVKPRGIPFTLRPAAAHAMMKEVDIVFSLNPQAVEEDVIHNVPSGVKFVPLKDWGHYLRHIDVDKELVKCNQPLNYNLRFALGVKQYLKEVENLEI